MTAFLHDLRYAVRLWQRTPGFTAVAVLALALGIGANTAIFTIVDAVLVDRLPYKNADRLVVVWEDSVRRPGRANTVGPANFLQWRDRASAFEQMAGIYDTRVNLTGQAEPEEVIAMGVTSNFFSTLGVSPLIGRDFTPDEGPGGRDRLVVLSYALWQRRFGGDASIVGQAIQLNSQAFTVIGVMPPEIGLFLKAGSLTGKPAELWMPFAFTEAQRQPRGRYLSAIARLKPDVSLDQARTQMATIASSLTKEWPDFDTGWSVRLVPIHEELSGAYRPALLVLFGAVAFVLLIACANVANLLLARGAVRQREIAVRLALGAARGRVVRQLLTESLVLGLAGGALGLLVAQWSLDGMLALSPVDLTNLSRIRLSFPALAFTGGVSILTALVCGLVPAFEGSRTDVQDGLKAGARQAGGGVRHRRFRDALVVSEIALAVALLVGAGLMLRTFANLRGVDPGFDAHHVLTLRASLPLARYATSDARVRFFQDAVARVRELPGVTSAGAISFLPFASLGAATGFTIAGQPPPLPGQDAVTDVRVCDDGYFESMRIPLLRGRLFTPREMREKADVVIVNQALARRYFADQDPIGRKLLIQMTRPLVPTEIIGVVADVKPMDLAADTRPMTYWAHPQLAYNAMTITVRTAGDPLAMAPAVASAVQSIDKDQPVSDVRTMDQWMARSLATTRFSSLLLAVFAGLALLLAAIGIYGVMSYAVSQRTPEIGIRLALGADTRSVLRLIVGNGLGLAAAGLITGVALSLALARTLKSLLFHTGSTDPATFVAVVALLAAVALLACYLPARRASRIAPVDALRYQ